MDKHHYVVIMAGGIGSRFWPVSRTDKPKQFLDILNSGKTLIQWTYERFAEFIPAERILVVTHNLYRNLVQEQLPKLPPGNILCEPSRKNTAPCIAYGSYRILRQDPEANILFAPADHLVLDTPSFIRSCREALEFVSARDALVTLGIKPTRPDTGYGYIQYDTKKIVDGVFRVKTFTEKPNFELAATFLKSGDFLWNAGIFAWNVQSIVRAFEKHLPEIHELFQPELTSLNTSQEADVIEVIYSQCTNISIDYGVMEKADNVFVIPSDFGWSDLGTWVSAYENLPKDPKGNAIIGRNVVIIDASGNMIKAPHEKLVVLQGMNGFILIDTPDVLLVCRKDQEQQIKEFVAEVKRHKGDRFL